MFDLLILIVAFVGLVFAGAGMFLCIGGNMSGSRSLANKGLFLLITGLMVSGWTLIRFFQQCACRNPF